MSGSPINEQRHFRVRIDGLPVDSTPTWAAAEDVNFWPGYDAPFRVRFAISNTGTGTAGTFSLFYELNNSGTWVAVTTTSNVVRAVDACSHTNGSQVPLAANLRLTAGSGTAVAGRYTESGLSNGNIAAASYSEYEFGIQLRDADIAAGDVIKLRAQATAAFATYTNIPTFTAPAADSAPSGPTTYQLSDTASDLTGVSVNKRLEETGAAGSWSGQSLARNDTGLTTSIADGSFFTVAGVPGADGNNSSGKYADVSLDISSGNSLLRYSVRLARVNSSGVVQAWGPLSAETTSGTSAVYTFQASFNGLGTWVSGDRLRLDVRLRNSSTTTGQSSTLTYASANSAIQAETSVVGATLTPSLFSNSQTYYTQTVSVGAVTLSPSLFSNSQTFFTQTVSQVTQLTPSLFSNSQTFYTQAVAQVTQLTPSLFSNSQTFFTQTVSVGAVTLTPSLYTDTDTFYTQTVSAGAVTLTPSLFSNSQTFYTQTVSVGAVTLTPSLFSNSQTFYAHSLSQTGGGQTLSPDLFADGDTFYTPTVAGGGVTVAPSLFSDADTFYTQTLTVGAVALAPPLHANSQTFYTQTVTTGVVSLTLTLFSNSKTFYTQTLQQEGGAQTIEPSLFADDDTFYIQSIELGGVTLSPALFENANTFYAHTIAQAVAEEAAIEPGHSAGVTVAYRRRWYEYVQGRKKRRRWRPGEGTLEEILRGVYEAEDELTEPVFDLQRAREALEASREAARRLEAGRQREAILQALLASQQAIEERSRQASDAILAQQQRQFEAIQEAVMAAALEWERREQDDLEVLLLCA